MQPVIILNLKVYNESAGPKALELAQIAESVAKDTGVPIIVAPPAPDLALVAKHVKIPVFAQHVDDVQPGAATGAVTLEGIKASGCAGSLVNHAEKKIRLAEIRSLIERALSLDLKTCVCTVNAAESKAVACLKPSFIAVEPPELIGTGVSVSTAKPEVITETIREVKSISNVPVLCGAGVSNGHDVKRALELGAEGVLLASAFVKAKDPRGVLTDMAKGTK
ncbi:MAG: triose-phosphate isomerase [Candidatus Micrarchaeia archaeon]